MPQKIPMKGVTVHRNGENIMPPIGKPFEFTNDEIKAVKKHDPSALRNPINESEAMPALNETDASLRRLPVPEADKTRDANVLARTKAKQGGKTRNQGGSQEEDDVAAGGPRQQDVQQEEAEEGLPSDDDL